MVSTTPVDELNALLDAAVDAIVLIDCAGHIEVFNPAAERLFGYATAEVLGRNVSILMTEEDARTHDGHIAHYLATRVPHIIGRGREVTARRKDASLFPAFLSVGVVATSESTRFVGFIQDLTLRRQGEDAMRRLQERLWHVSRFATMGEMTSGIAHELNQPLAAIANYSQACDRLLSKPNPEISEVRDALKEITEQAVRAGDIIRKLRALVSRAPNPERRHTDINALVSELTPLVQTTTKAHGVQYRVELGTDLPALKVHPDELQQVILNLVRNAIESLDESDQAVREIVVRTDQTAEGDVQISVCDNGPGVSADIIPFMFEPFCTSKPAGTGLGLAMSRTIVGRHRGTLQYQALVPTGAGFFVRLSVHSD